VPLSFVDDDICIVQVQVLLPVHVTAVMGESGSFADEAWMDCCSWPHVSVMTPCVRQDAGIVIVTAPFNVMFMEYDPSAATFIVPVGDMLTVAVAVGQNSLSNSA
jgi:hypothetical protein